MVCNCVATIYSYNNIATTNNYNLYYISNAMGLSIAHTGTIY